jgi:hypothetical protein
MSLRERERQRFSSNALWNDLCLHNRVRISLAFGMLISKHPLSSLCFLLRLPQIPRRLWRTSARFRRRQCRHGHHAGLYSERRGVGPEAGRPLFRSRGLYSRAASPDARCARRACVEVHGFVESLIAPIIAKLTNFQSRVSVTFLLQVFVCLIQYRMECFSNPYCLRHHICELASACCRAAFTAHTRTMRNTLTCARITR